jgi:hypothetical protein
MKISHFVANYTEGRVLFRDVWDEVVELYQELVKFDKKGIKEEAGDVACFFQMWLHDRFAVEGDLWKIGMSSYEKFMERQDVWKEIYRHVGLDENSCTICRNYNKSHKVVNHLKEKGISLEMAMLAYNEVVLK